MKDKDIKIFVFMIIGVIEVLATQKKNSMTKNDCEIRNNNLTLYMVLLIDLIAYVIASKLEIAVNYELVIQLILLIVTML